MIKLVYSLFLISFLSFSYAQSEFNYSTDFDSILAKTKDSKDDLFYPKLLERFQKDHSTLSDKEVLSLMIGFTANENYKPYENLDKEAEIFKLIGAKKYEEAIEKCDAFLETNPLNYSALMEKGYALWKLDDDRFEFHKAKYFKILDAIMYSGDGTVNNAFFVLSPMDGQRMIQYIWGGSLGIMGSGRDDDGNFLDILEMEKEGEKTLTIYFNIEHAMKNSELKKQIDKAIDEKK